MVDPGFFHHVAAAYQSVAGQPGAAAAAGTKRNSIAEWDYVWGVWGSAVAIMGLYGWRTRWRGRRLSSALPPDETLQGRVDS